MLNLSKTLRLIRSLDVKHFGFKRLGMFVGLLAVYLINRIGLKIICHGPLRQESRRSWAERWNWAYRQVLEKIDKQQQGNIRGIYLIDLAVKNMKAKKARTLITVGGMAIGVGAIVFLVSVGYGLQQLVINRVARLEEMRQADVTPQPGGKVKITDKTLADFKQIPGVREVLPLIAVVGRVNYQNSISDMAVYAVTSNYLEQSAIRPSAGSLYESNELVNQMEKKTTDGEVAGVSTDKHIGEFGQEIGDVQWNVFPSEWVRLRAGPSIKANTVGYTRRMAGDRNGTEYWGGNYTAETAAGEAGSDVQGNPLGKWVKASFPVWEKSGCTGQPECEDGQYRPAKDEWGGQKFMTAFAAEVNLQITKETLPEVLGLMTDEMLLTEVLAASDEAWIEIASESAAAAVEKIDKVKLGEKAKKEAVVNRAMLKVLGIKEGEAVGKTFETVFVVLGNLMDSEHKAESEAAQYTIKGVIPDEKTPVFYVPFTDIRSLGVVNYSQIKLVTNDKQDLAKVRKQIEALGYTTRSAADTVAQINSLFGTARMVLALLGMVALAVASLGMFNTLTVSLLERTREVGLMKAMGMKSSEIQELFLTESMIMGLSGGLAGIVLGFVLGKVLGLLLSVFAVVKGVGIVDVSAMPLIFVSAVAILSLVVGIFTGLYPAKRATKISALNALRYE